MKTVKIMFIGAMNWGYNRLLLQGVARYARVHQWSLAMLDPATRSELAASDRHVDGIILSPHPLLTAFENGFHCPAVSLSADREDDPLPRVLNDDLATGRLAAEHFIGRGFRHLAFVGDSSGKYWITQRCRGFSEKAEEYGLKCRSFGAEAFAAGKRRPDAFTSISLQRWLRRLPRPLGILACNDDFAARTLSVCRRLGARIPEDIAVVGVNNEDLYAELSDPPLSSIAQQNDRLGYEASAVLAQLIAGRRPAVHVQYLPPGELIVRQSSDVIATDDAVVTAAVRFIQQRLSSGVSVKQLLAESDVSRSTLDARFRAALGRTASEEIRRARIERAKQLLSTSDLAMPEVASLAGFSKAGQFSESFRHEVHLTPTAYRQRFRLR